MKALFRSFLRLACAPVLAALLATGVRAAAEPTQESLATVGVTAVGGGQTWAYLTWVTNSTDLLDARTYALYSKPGPANTATPYTRAAIVRVQMDPSAIGALISRAAVALGEDTTALDEVVRGLFQDLMPSGSIGTPERVSAVVRGAIGNPAHLKNLMIAAKAYPSLSMIVGRAHAVPIPASGPVTFEVREFNPDTERDVAVVGRATVDGSNPLGIAGLLPAPSVLMQPPLNPALGKNDLVIRFVWDTPTAFRQLALMTHGFNLYRVSRSFAESNGLHLAAPSGAMLKSLAVDSPLDVQRVNRAPITPDRALTAAEVFAVTHDVVFFTDEQSKFPGYPTTHRILRNGDEYYYFVTPRDILGRDDYSAATTGLLGTFCSRMPPPNPRGLKVVNDYSYNGTTGRQVLKLSWNPNPSNEQKLTTAYAVYRWNSTDEIYTLGGNPTNNLVAIVPSGGPLEFVDDGTGSPSDATDLGKTFWYTVRAIDDGSGGSPGGAGVGVVAPGAACAIAPFGGNLSGHGGPAFGVLRDRVGPPRPNGVLTFLCPDPQIDADRKVDFVTDERLDTTSYRIKVRVTQTAFDPQMEWAEFVWVPAQSTAQFLGRVPFQAGNPVLDASFNLPWNMPEDMSELRVRVGLRNGEVSSYAVKTFPRPHTAQGFLQFYFLAHVEYRRVTPGESTGRIACRGHVVPPAGSLAPGENPGVKLEFFPTLGTKQWKLYTRIDGGELTLAKENSGDFDLATLVTTYFDALPAVQSRICFFLQVFDINGNPSPLVDVGCVDVDGTQPLPTPMLAPIVSTGTTGAEQATLQWFSTPYGVHHFEVWVSSSPAAPADDIDGPGASLLEHNTDYPEPTQAWEVVDGAPTLRTYKVWDTERVGPAFGAGGATFTVTALPALGAKWRVKVRAVSSSGAKGAFSNAVEYEWTAPVAVVGPDVPWPQRPLPAVNSAFFGSDVAVDWLNDEGCVGIRIGLVPGRFSFDQQEKYRIFMPTEPLESWLFQGKFGSGVERSVLPVVVYRVQQTDPSGLYPASGDVVQVTPLLESIADSIITSASGGNVRILYDPFFSARNVVLPDPTGAVSLLYIKDTQPVVGGCVYRYLLVLLDPVSKEVVGVVPTRTIHVEPPAIP